jgi:hypothetical protein
LAGIVAEVMDLAGAAARSGHVIAVDLGDDEAPLGEVAGGLRGDGLAGHVVTRL